MDGALKDLPAPPPNLAQAVADYVGDAHAYVLLTRNMREYEALFGRPRWGTIAQLESAMSRSPLFERVYANRDGAIYELRPPPHGMQR